MKGLRRKKEMEKLSKDYNLPYHAGPETRNDRSNLSIVAYF